MLTPLLHLESDPRGEMTHYGGLVLAQQFVRRFGVSKRLDDRLMLFKRPRALSRVRPRVGAGLHAIRRRHVFGGPIGIARERGDAAAGGSVSDSGPDHGRRFSAPRQNSARCRATLGGHRWSSPGGGLVEAGSRGGSSQEEEEFALVDLDGHIKPLYGVQKERGRL